MSDNVEIAVSNLHSNLVEIVHHGVKVRRLLRLELLENDDVSTIRFAIPASAEVFVISAWLAVEYIFQGSKNLCDVINAEVRVKLR